jgi:transposase
MDKYMGLDAHSASCTLAVVSGGGRRLRELVLDTDAGALNKAVRAVRGRRHLCLEEGTHSSWLYEVLEPCVDELVVTRGVRTCGVKDDRRDAFALAEALRVGQLESVIYKPGCRLRLLRELARTHRMISGDLTRVRNRVKATFRARGIPTAGRGVYGRSKREVWLAKLDAASRATAELLLKQLDAPVDLDAESSRQLVRESHRHPISRVLETAPGIGPIRAAELMAVVVSPHRFRTAKQFLSYSGLGIVTRSSADWVREDGQWVRARVPRTIGLNRRHNRTLKVVFKGAATTVLSSRCCAPLCDHYERLLEEGTKPNLAKLTIARRIAAIVLAIYKSEEVFDPQRLSTVVTS